MVNELAGRYGLTPFDFEASLDVETGHFRFESGGGGGKYPAFQQMVTAVGCENDAFPGNIDELYHALNEAIREAPRALRSR